MNGMNAETGIKLSGIEHLRQSVVDILTTPIGTRVMRLDYGSKLFELIDQPIVDDTFIDIKAAVAEALAKWERRILLKKVEVTKAENGHIEVSITGTYLEENTEFIMDGIIIS